MSKRHSVVSTLATGLLLSVLSACSGGGSGGGGGTAPPPSYPDPANPSAYPTQKDSLEGSGDNTPATAGTLIVDSFNPPFNNIQYRTIYSVDDVDWVKVNLPNTIAYEFSVDNVSTNGYPVLELYQGDGTTLLDTDYGYFDFGSNPRILYTPSTTGTYYLKISGSVSSVFSYTLSAHEYHDGDVDTYSTYYDCDDTNPAYQPELTESQGGTAGNGFDESCTGHDWLDQDLADSFEDGDDDATSTTTLPIAKGDPWDTIHRPEVYAQTHTLETLSGDDVDYFKITVPANTAYYVLPVETTGIVSDFSTTIYDSDGTTVVEAKLPGIDAWLDNTITGQSDYPTYNATVTTAKVWYVKIERTTPGTKGVYAAAIVDFGTDADQDGYYSKHYSGAWDCDDTDPDVYGVTEVAPADGIDSNCNGADDT